MINVNWSEQLKIRIRETTEAQAKHLVVKTIINFLIRLKHSHQLKHQLIYSEFPINELKIADCYHENIKTKEIICYEVQNDASDKYIKETNKIYEEYEELKTLVGFKSVDWVLIKLKDCPEDLNDLVEYLKEKII